MKRAQKIIIIQINRYRLDIMFNTSDAIFLSSKNIKTKRLYKKLDNKKYNLFKIKDLIRSLYRLKLLSIIRIHDIFHLKLLSLAITNPLLK